MKELAVMYILLFAVVALCGCRALSEDAQLRSPTQPEYQFFSMSLLLWVEWVDEDDGTTNYIRLDSNRYFAVFRPEARSLAELAREPIRKEEILSREKMRERLRGHLPPNESMDEFISSISFQPEEVGRVDKEEIEAIVERYFRKGEEGSNGWVANSHFYSLDLQEANIIIAALIKNDFVVQRSQYGLFLWRFDDWESPFRHRDLERS